MNDQTNEISSEPMVSIHRLGILARMDRAALERKLHGVEPAPNQTGKARLFRLSDVLPVLCHATKDEETARRLAAHRERQAAAEANSAELKAAKEIGLLMFTADAKRFWADGFVKMRQEILKTPGLTSAQQKELSERMSKVRLEGD